MTTILNQSASSQQTDELKRLRELVLGDEYRDAIEQVVDKGFSRNVADVVSEAIEIRNQQDDTIGQALAPVVDTALKKSIEKSPQSIVNVIFPIIGPSIRKAVSSAILDLLLSINQLIERSVGIRSLKWRIEAWREGTPYAKYILLKNIKYRVDQVFLIQKETGILMASMNNRFYQDADNDLVSSMLTAINDFVIDSFNATEEETLERIRFGDRVIQINVGQKVILAVAVTGLVSHEVKERAIETLESIELNQQDLIAEFDGDTETMHAVLPALENCLVEKKHIQAEKKSRPWIAYSLVLVGALWLTLMGYQSWVVNQKIARSISFIKSQQAVALLGHKLESEQVTFDLLQDPSSGDLSAQLEAIFGNDYRVVVNATYANLDQNEVWLNYLNNHYRFTNKPQMDLAEGILFIRGEIDANDLAKLNQDDLVTSKFTTIDVSDARVVSPLTAEQLRNIEISKLKNKINAVQLFFETSKTALNPSEQSKLRVLAEDLLELQRMANGDLSILGQVLILGFADSAGTAQKNLNLSEDRAKYVSDYFVAQGIDQNLIVIHPMGHVDVKNLDAKQQRRVTVSVISSRSGRAEKNIEQEGQLDRSKANQESERRLLSKESEEDSS
ncbi:OmpA family protein [Aliikangiella marina]|uniref:OmpA family protein n=1 Tax=Aliikangiella marina TaxID=1712262 RepID=A0A545TJ57_9GAMM|nr:OmpA family protein [Aliikangiella marina]TQV77274.1 OmpA family protein [Aliikangiella marina]